MAEETKAIWAYPNKYSFFPGETLEFRVSSDSGSNFGFKIYALTSWNGGYTDPIFTSDTGYKSSSYTAPNNGVGGRVQTGVEDWNWPVSASYTVDEKLKSGIYFAEITAYSGPEPSGNGSIRSYIYFVVKNPSPNPDASRILFKVNLATVHAYNLANLTDTRDWQFAADFYNRPTKSPWDTQPEGYKVTMRRPVTAGVSDQFGWAWEHKCVMYDYPMAKWLERQGPEYAADFCTDVDLHMDTNGDMLSKYNMLLSVGHDEYWSQEMRDNVEAFIKKGGNVAFLSGNTCYWRIQFTDCDPTLGNIPTAFVCDKGTLTNIQDGAGPDAWWKLAQKNPLIKPENTLTGVSTRNGGARPEEPTAVFAKTSPSSPGYTVQNAEHWVFQGSGLKNGDVVGNGNVTGTDGNPLIENLIGYECDGARCEERDGRLVPTFTDGTPENFEVLAFAKTEPYQYAGDRKDGQWSVFLREDSKGTVVSGLYAATMGIYENTGRVFTAGTIYWCRILNEWDADYGANNTGYTHQPMPMPWQGRTEPLPDEAGNPICGNTYLHHITRNVLNEFMKPRESLPTS
jgi:hypothetical protein